MKTIIFIFINIILLSPLFLIGQTSKRGEIGLFAGGSFYTGELNRVPFVGTTPSGGLFYKHTFHTRLALKGTGTIGKLKGDGNRLDGEPVNFNNWFYDIAATGEFNFMPYLPAHKKYIFSPYLLAGIGVMYYPDGPNATNTKLILNIPIGIGVKYNINESLTCGVEFSVKKTFSDYYDYTTSGYDKIADKQQLYEGDKDWVTVFGVYIAHKIKYRTKCPAFD